MPAKPIEPYCEYKHTYVNFSALLTDGVLRVWLVFKAYGMNRESMIAAIEKEIPLVERDYPKFDIVNRVFSVDKKHRECTAKLTLSLKENAPTPHG